MKTTPITLQRFDADEGYVFDWKVPVIDEETNETQHLFAKTLFLAQNDSIDNYIEVLEESLVKED